MNTVIILGISQPKDRAVFIGYGNGKDARKRLDLDRRDEEILAEGPLKLQFEIYVASASAVFFMHTYLVGLFADSVLRLGRKRFLESYRLIDKNRRLFSYSGGDGLELFAERILRENEYEHQG